MSEYVCVECGDVFESTWTDEEALAEAVENFGDQLGNDPVVICDDCYWLMTATYPIADFLADEATS